MHLILNWIYSWKSLPWNKLSGASCAQLSILRGGEINHNKKVKSRGSKTTQLWSCRCREARVAPSHEKNYCFAIHLSMNNFLLSRRSSKKGTGGSKGWELYGRESHRCLSIQTWNLISNRNKFLTWKMMIMRKKRNLQLRKIFTMEKSDKKSAGKYSTLSDFDRKNVQWRWWCKKKKYLTFFFCFDRKIISPLVARKGRKNEKTMKISPLVFIFRETQSWQSQF